MVLISFTIMRVFELDIPSDRGLTNFDLACYVKILKVPHFFFMQDELPKATKSVECSIMNLNKSDEIGSH